MANPSPALIKGIVRGRTIELEREPGLPDGQQVDVAIRPVEDTPRWLERLTVDPSVQPGKLVVRGTRLLAEDLATLVEAGLGDDELRAQHPELTADDVAAVRQYALVPQGLRHAFGGWAGDAEELDEYLDWTRRQRKIGRREVEERASCSTRTSARPT